MHEKLWPIVLRQERADGWRSSVAKAKAQVLWCPGLREDAAAAAAQNAFVTRDG